MSFWPPWLRLAWQHPELLTEHAAAYAALVADEAGLALDHALRRGLRQLAAAACVAVAATLGGVSVLLWATLPLLADGRAWALVAVPLVPLLAAGALWPWAPRTRGRADFAGLRAQLSMDRAAWQAAQAARRPLP